MTFGMKTWTKIGCWNVRTMAEASHLAQTMREMSRYKLEILCLCETRWNESGGEHVTTTGELLLFSGRPQGERHKYGVGLLPSKPARRSLV
jgi:hypothetical protein